MEQIPSYNLLQAIDPTKIKVPISDRFAKLTLSSNKKQQQKCKEPEQQEELKRIQEKRDSVSRNISKEFDDENKENKQNLPQNPLLRSESSKESENNNTMAIDQEEEELTMDPLELSQDHDNPTQLEYDLELLTQQVASMAVEYKPISLSSGSTCNLSEITELVSTESQRSSTSDANNVHIVHHIPINVKEAVERQTIFLNLPSSTNDNIERNYEMTEDEDEEGEEEEDEDEAITISDTSESHHDQAQDIMAISSLPSTSITSQSLVLPSQIDDKAERVAAFLRDVSIEQRIIEQGQLVFTDTLDQLLDNIEVDKINETLEKSRQIATADTESMTPDVDEEVTYKSVVERKNRLKALDKSIGNEQKIKNYPEMVTENEETSENSTQIRKQLKVEEKNVHRLMNDETQDNTVITDSDEDEEVEKIPKHVSYLKTSHENVDLKTPNTVKQDLYRMVHDETLCNTESSLSKETPKIHSNRKNKNQITENNENMHKIANTQIEENTALDLSHQKNTQIDPRRLANDDTMANTIITDIEDAVTQPSLVYNYSQDYKTPEKINKLTVNEEAINISVVSIQTTPESSHDLDQKQHSFDSVINSSTEQNDDVPEHSITILETDDESIESKSLSQNQNSADKKLSNSFHREDTSDGSEYDEQMSQIQMSMGNINISAKINIKIHIPNNSSTETSEDEHNYVGYSKENERGSKQLNQLTTEKQSTNNDKEVLTDNDESFKSNEHIGKSDLPETECNQLQLKPSPEVSASAINSSDSIEVVEDKKFLSEAEKLLTQLYGKAWQTPDVIRTLKRRSQSGDKKSDYNKTTSTKNNDIKNIEQKKSNSKNVVEESILDDFSIFRQNIVKTNLDSTRLGTPKPGLKNKQVFTEPRNNKKLSQKEKINAKFMPKSERRPAARVAINKGSDNNTKWRQLIDQDSNSEGDNASDDEDADESWSKNASELELENSDSDFENSSTPRARGKQLKTKKRQGRSIKSDYLTKILNKTKDGEIVYLDLSKEEVEVQDEVPKSPPANHDAIFASRIEDILKTCRHEDKPKLPPSNKKTKRKLFTPNFGDDGFEAALPIENENKNKGIAGQTIRGNDEYEVLEDNGHCPFDSMGRPKVLDLVNKRLESVKTGKPIFDLTPSPKKKTTATNVYSDNDKTSKINESSTPKSKSDNEAKFKTPLAVKSKTPLTAKSKGPPKSFKDLYQTPNYKYSFLKSLDVTVSKALCHPDALYYRDNYRTKKEELSTILYELYNEKLFEDKLNVPIVWNKKLLNTAGRCLNKKKMGLRSSVIELSHKVLTSADRLRCTLIHELCHAATWIFNGEGGHGSTWKEWARKANAALPEIPKIGVCHQYDIEYKYTYKCTLCAAKSHAHSKSKKVENIRCSYCHGAIEIFLNKKDKDGNIIPTPVKEPTGFAKFVQDNYKKFKRDDRKHADVMKLLSSEFASLKVATN